ncbi:DMT family transporter [uncultured Umboniibacter sp.]|uniref:DMT family transporter n=1 Tax=uncultured Umboniibacter sp. TaxID=1798917 RepID=UPI00260BC6E1|nr:DMT family transporter [uncultured Umboniibacter sp.]
MHRSILYGLLAVLLWSTVATAFKLALKDFSVIQLLALSVSISAVVLWVVVLASSSRANIRPTFRKRFKLLALAGLLNPATYYLVLFEAYDRLPAQIAQPVNYTWAIAFSWLAVPFLKKPLRRVDKIASVLGYLGVVVIALQGKSPADFDIDLLGLSLALFSTLLWAGYWLLATRISGDAVVNLAISFSVAVPLVWSMVLYSGEVWPQNPSYLSVIWVGLFEMSITFLLWQKALSSAVNVSKVANLIFLSPFISLILIGVILGEQLHLTTFAGLALILVAVIWQQRSKTT